MASLSIFRDVPAEPIDRDTVLANLSIDIFFLRFSLNDTETSFSVLYRWQKVEPGKSSRVGIPWKALSPCLGLKAL
jgi:hypothetical protein